MKENSDSEDKVTIVKKNDDENIMDQSVIEKIKASEQLSIDKMREIIERCIKAKQEDQKANIIDENFLRLVWSFNLGYYKEKNEKGIDYNGWDKNLLYNLFFYCADEFFYCLYLLDIGFNDLAPVVQKRIKEDDYKKECSNKYPNQYNIIHKPWRKSIASKMFYDPKKPLDVGFFVWLKEKGYFAKHDVYNITVGEYHGKGDAEHYSKHNDYLPSFDEFESICENRKKNRMGNYKFETFDEFKSFVGLDEDDDQEYYSQVGISVKSLLDVLKNKNRFLTKDEFIKLVNRENIFFDKPENLTEDDIEEWNNYKNFINKSGIITNEEKEKRREARAKYWEYIKCILFDNTKGDAHSLLDIKIFSDNGLESIASCLSNKFEFFTGIQLFCDSADIFDNNDSKYKKYIADDLKKFKNLFLQTNSFISRMDKINDHINKNGAGEDNPETSSNVTRRIIGIILLLIGIIGCGLVLGLGLPSKLAVYLLFLFVFMTITGISCLLWEKINCCLTLNRQSISNLMDPIDSLKIDKGEFRPEFDSQKRENYVNK